MSKVRVAKETFQEKINRYLFLLAFNIIPTVWYTGIIPHAISSIGQSTIMLIVFLPVIINSLRYYRKVEKQIWFISVFIACFVAICFIYSSKENGVLLSYTIIRYAMMNIWVFVLSLPYIYSLDKIALYRIIHSIIILCLIESIIYILHTIGLLHIYGGLVFTYTIGSMSVNRIYAGIPVHLTTIICIVFTLYIITQKSKYIYYFLFFIFTLVFTYTRGTLGSCLLSILIATFLLSIKNIIKLGQLSLLIIAIIIGFLLISFIFPDTVAFWDRLINNTINNDLKNDTGTYAFREDLIDEAYRIIQHGKKILFGFGYIREPGFVRGDYSWVIGGDSHVPPIIYCEGLVGLSIRFLLVIYLILKCARVYLKSRIKVKIIASVFIISLYLPQVFNYVQSSCFMFYTGYLLSLPFYILLNKIYIKKHETT